jgi:dTDP-glucose 4,6-dehydratase
VNKILIAGAGGFIGSYLTEKMVELGYQVKAFLRYNSRNNWGWLEDSAVKNEIEVIMGDIRDYDSVYGAMEGCDSVFHLAALIGIPYSYISPLAYVKTNIEGTYNVLNASKHLELSNVIITSTSETYGTAQYVPIDEKHPLVGQSPYSASKISSDQLALSYYKSYSLPIKIVRPFNTYGPRQSARAIIPSVIIQILQGSEIINSGNLEPTRDFTFIDDTVSGFIEIFKTSRLFGEVINIGTGKEISINNLIGLIIKLMESKCKVHEEENRIRPRGSEVERLCCDNTLIKKSTNWDLKYSLEEGLKITIEWFKQNSDLYKSNIYNI